MKRTEMIEQLLKIYQTKPEGCSDYHIIDMLLSRAERLGMLPPVIPIPSGLSYYAIQTLGDRHKWESEDE